MSCSAPLDNPKDAFLNPDDGVAISFWIISIAMIAATVFFIAESRTVSTHWKLSLHVGSLVTMVAAVHYMYMREYWVQVHNSPIIYRYVDWIITVPLQMIEFNLILKAAKKPCSPWMFWRLLFGTVVMLAFGYAGETNLINPQYGFSFGCTGWAFILYEIFMGEAGGIAGSCTNAVVNSFNAMRFIVTIGWSIYPLGYYFGYLLGDVDEAVLNVVYNLADFVNKIAFVLACWSAAKEESADDMLSDLYKQRSALNPTGEYDGKCDPPLF